MRHMASIVAVLLIAGFASASTAAGPSAPSSADLAFLASLEDSPMALPDMGTPSPQSMACSVTNDCDGSTPVTCTGNSSCQTTIAGVKCDGNEVQCPNFCSISQSCQCCNGTYYGTCWSRRGDCQYTSEGIACNGVTFTCDSTCPLCPEW